MLYDVAVGPFPEQPARKDATPLIVGGAADVELQESAGLGRVFPGRGGFAGAQADDRVAQPQRLSRFHAEVAGQAVALVEQADHRDARAHRRAGQAIIADAAAVAAYLDRAAAVRDRNVAASTGVKRAGQKKRQEHFRQDQFRQEPPRRNPDHDASGLHAS